MGEGIISGKLPLCLGPCTVQSHLEPLHPGTAERPPSLDYL